MTRNANRNQSQYAPRSDGRSSTRSNARRGTRLTIDGQGRKAQEAQHWVEETQHFRSCIDACNAAFAYAIEENPQEYADAICFLVDAIEVCGVTANLVARESEFAEQAEELCAEVTKACEEALEEFGDDPVLTAAADACRECAEACSS